MSTAADALWRATGVRWPEQAPVLGWSGPGGERHSPLAVGGPLGFRVGADRRCLGVRRNERRIACPAGAVLPARVHGGQCPDCASLDRMSSVATDAVPDDPQPYRVYLAHHGGTVKVGITAARRGIVRLLEQGALSSVFLAEGPLMAARRAEHVLGAALGLPERVLSPAKRAARRSPGSARQRADRLEAVRAAALRAPGWPESLASDPAAAILDHCPAYGIPEAGVGAAAELRPLAPGAVVAGTITHVVGTDLYLAAGHGLVLVDARLVEGWSLAAVPPGAAWDAAVREPERPADGDGEQLGLDWPGG